ncbi:MAG: hypothetical protein ACKOWF_01850 [Chloroflexota bacterium]
MTASSVTPLRPGDPAPDLTLRDATGAPVQLSSFWNAAPRALALVFVRHFG